MHKAIKLTGALTRCRDALPSESLPARRSGRKPSSRPIYYFDIVHDYPTMGGVVEFSRILFRQLKRRYGHRLISAREASARLGGPDAGMLYLDRETVAAELLAAADPDSIFFFPNYHSPLVRKAGAAGPRIVNVIHDVQFDHLPELFSPARLGWLYAAYAATRENADHVVFVSRTTQMQYCACFGAPRSHSVIYNPVEIGEPDAAVATGDAPFLLAPVHHHPHKNFTGLLSLFAELAERMPELTLVVTGHGGHTFEKDLAAIPEAVRARVKHLGYVPRRELDALYGQARAFVTLSRFEGFNMSAAEASCHGTPLILSDLPVHRELYAEQACFLDLAAPPAAQAAQAAAALASDNRIRAPWPFRRTCDPAKCRTCLRACDRHLPCGRPHRSPRQH